MSDLILNEKYSLNHKLDFEPFLENPEPGTYLFHREKSGEVCADYQATGNCPRGNACSFRHAPVKEGVVCKHWLRGLCKKGDECEFVHVFNLSRMPECYFYSKYGECNNAECLYMHLDAESKKVECQWYLRGFCRHGNRCDKRHKRRVACADYLDGFCALGPACEYGHPKAEYDEHGPVGISRRVMCRFCGDGGHKQGNCPKLYAMQAEDRMRREREIRQREEWARKYNNDNPAIPSIPSNPGSNAMAGGMEVPDGDDDVSHAAKRMRVGGGEEGSGSGVPPQIPNMPNLGNMPPQMQAAFLAAIQSQSKQMMR